MSSADDLSICDLSESDYAEMAALWERAGLPTRPDGRDGPAALARQMARGCQRIVGLRTAGGALAALVVLTHDGRKGWINRLAVDPAYRRRGLARLLIAEAERWFTEDVGLEVWAALIESHNTASQALFEREGFTTLDIRYVTKRTRADA